MIDLPPIDDPQIVVIASRAEERADDTPATVTVIERARIERIGSPLVPDLLRLVPSVSVGVSGPAGSQAQVRIRGAEANHTLLFVEGIRANDPSSGNEPRFELLNADLASRIEVVRGPQSALWGSEAIGGVVAVRGELPGSGGTQALVEGGSRATWRGAARSEAGDMDRGIAIGVAAQKSSGIDSFLGGGDKDGYSNIGLRGAARYRLSPLLLVGASGFALRGKSEFDGYNDLFLRDDTEDESRNRMTAGRLFAEYGKREQSYVLASASLLGSSNRNFVANQLLNSTNASRRTLALEAGHHVGRHQFIAAVESEREQFHARGNNPNQDQKRHHNSLTLEWRAEGLGPLGGSLAVRHDIFSAFHNATSVRASIRAEVASGWSIAASYAQGIAQPTFYDLFGFFPDQFSGNPGLKPESSRGGEVALRYASDRVGWSVTYFRQTLDDEIATVFLPDFTSTAVNAEGRSRRQGAEIEGYFEPGDAMRVTLGYAYLDADEPGLAGESLKEVRRPRHSGSVAIDGRSGRIAYGVALAYTGARLDTDFESFPARSVHFGAYWLASARLAYGVTDTLEAQLRLANAFDADYQDAVGYRTEGRSVHAGLRLALGR